MPLFPTFIDTGVDAIALFEYPAGADHPAVQMTMAEASHYAATQRFIVDKTAFFRRIVTDNERALTVAEVGVGPGGFLQHVADEGALPRAHLTGADLSAAMVRTAAGRMRPRRRAVTLVAGVDALDPASPLYLQHLRPASLDLIVLSQFEHSAPNEPESPLAQRLRTQGLPHTTKAALRRLLAERLRPGGRLCVIDDFHADTPEEDHDWERAWDEHVVRQFADPAVMAALAGEDPRHAAQIAAHYAASRPAAVRLTLAARARRQRRHRRLEETQSLAEARADFVEVFGAARTTVMRHPTPASHPGFFMLCGQR